MNDVHMKFDKWKYVYKKRIFQPEILVFPRIRPELRSAACWKQTESGPYHGNDSNGLF